MLASAADRTGVLGQVVDETTGQCAITTPHYITVRRCAQQFRHAVRAVNHLTTPSVTSRLRLGGSTTYFFISVVINIFSHPQHLCTA